MNFKEKLQGCFSVLTHYFLFRLFIFCIASVPVIANALVASDIHITDVTPSSFTVVWVDEPNATGSIDLYSNVLGTQPVTDAVLQDQFTDSNSISLANQARANGVLRVRVSNLSANTPYFFKLNYTNSVSGVLPVSGPLFAVKTLLTNAVVSNEGITIDVFKPDGLTGATGAVLLAQVDGSPYPVSHLVGDATADNTAVVNLSNLFSGGINRELVGGELLDITVLSGNQERVQLTTTVPVNNKKGELEVIAPGSVQLQSTVDGDGDGIPDWYEQLHGLVSSSGDADGDTLTDLQEYQLGSDPNSQDSDGDGWTDNQEINVEGTSATNADSDLDGIEDDEEALFNTDPLNGDSDGDGALDGDELAAGTDPTDEFSVPVVDIDSDGAGDIANDNCVGIPNADQSDIDADGIGDVCDDDIDGDGILNSGDNSPFNSNSNQSDGDNDGIGDVSDNCFSDYNPAQIDTDGDLIGDECDPNDDNDAYNDFYPPIPASDIPYKFITMLGISTSTFDVIENSNAAIGIYKYDPGLPEGQEDVLVGIIEMANFQWVGEVLAGADLTDLRWLAIRMDVYGCNCFNTRESDNFTLLTDVGEITVYPPVSSESSFNSFSPLNVSIDGSTYSSSYVGQERLALLVKSAHEQTPLDNCRLDFQTDQLDSDGDGIGDVCDITAEDLDGDGVLNGADNCPTTYNPDQFNFDNDTLGDACDADSDNDGLSDTAELLFHTNPLSLDTDGDGIVDGDEDHDFDGILNHIEISNGDNPVIAQGRYKKGLNYFHYPNSAPQNLTAYLLLANLGGETNVANIQRINSATGLLEKAEYVAGVLQGTDFPVITGEGYLLEAAIDFTKDFTELLQCTGVNLVQGKNLIGFSCLPSSFGAYDLLEYLGGSSAVNSVQRFNTETGLFETATFVSGSPVGVDFDIRSTESYLVHARKVIDIITPTVVPNVIISSISDGLIVNTTQVEISGSVNDADLSIMVNGQLATITGNSFSAALNLPEGDHVIEIIAQSTNNLFVSQTINITVALTPVIIIESHVDGETVNQINPMIFGTVDRPVSEVRINGNIVQLTSDTTFQTYSNSTSLVDGLNQITIDAVSTFGASSEPTTLTLNRQNLLINAVNPGATTVSLNMSMSEYDLAQLWLATASPQFTDRTFGAPAGSFKKPFIGRILNANYQAGAQNITAMFDIVVDNIGSAVHEMQVDIYFKTSSGSTFASTSIPIQVTIQASAVAPYFLSGLETGETANVVKINPVAISGLVSTSTGEVLVNGVQAELYDEVNRKRYFALNVPLNKNGYNAITVEARGEAYALGDMSVTDTFTDRIYYKREEIKLTPTTNSRTTINTILPTRIAYKECGNLGCIDVLEDKNGTFGTDSSILENVAIQGITRSWSCLYKDVDNFGHYGCIELEYRKIELAKINAYGNEGIFDEYIQLRHGTSQHRTYIPIHATLMNSSDPAPVVVTFVSPTETYAGSGQSYVSTALVDVTVSTDDPSVPINLELNNELVAITPIINGNEYTWQNVPLEEGHNYVEFFVNGYLPGVLRPNLIYYTP